MQHAYSIACSVQFYKFHVNEWIKPWQLARHHPRLQRLCMASRQHQETGSIMLQYNASMKEHWDSTEVMLWPASLRVNAQVLGVSHGIAVQEVGRGTKRTQRVANCPAWPTDGPSLHPMPPATSAYNWYLALSVGSTQRRPASGNVPQVTSGWNPVIRHLFCLKNLDSRRSKLQQGHNARICSSSAARRCQPAGLFKHLALVFPVPRAK